MTDPLAFDLPGTRIAADRAVGDPERPVVVALHGLTSSRASEDAEGFFGWRPVAEGGRTLVRYDARGHGRSTGRPQPGDYRWRALAGDLLALLDQLSPDAPVDAVGVSMGVGTLLHAATTAPDRFRRLVLALPPTAWATRPAQREVYLSGARFIEQRGVAAFASGTASLPQLPILAEIGSRPSSPDVAEALLPSVFRGAADSDFPDGAAVRALAHETLLLPWADDPGHPVSTAHRLRDLMPNATLELTDTADRLRVLGSRVARFLG